MKSEVCKCGATTCRMEKFADSFIAICSNCGEPIKSVPRDKGAVNFYAFIYMHSRKNIQSMFCDEPKLLKEALRAKNVQEEENYKRKMGFSGDYKK